MSPLAQELATRMQALVFNTYELAKRNFEL